MKNNAFMMKQIILGALDTSLLIVAAFMFYKFSKEYNSDIVKFIPYGRKYHMFIIMMLHIIFIFLFDLILRFIFAYIFKIPI
jgi:hypothetical protein